MLRSVVSILLLCAQRRVEIQDRHVSCFSSLNSLKSPPSNFVVIAQSRSARHCFRGFQLDSSVPVWSIYKMMRLLAMARINFRCLKALDGGNSTTVL